MSTLAADTYNRSDQSAWGTASDGQTWALSGPTSWSIASNKGSVGISSSQNFMTIGSGTAAKVDITVLVTQTDTGALVGPMCRYSSSGGANCYRVGIWSGLLYLSKFVSGSQTLIQQVSLPGGYSLGESWWIRLLADGTSLKAKTWENGTSEPGSWDIDTTDSSISAAGNYGVSIFPSNGATVDDLTITDGSTTTTETRTVPSTIALQTTLTNTVPGTIALQTTNTNTVPSTIALQTEELHTVPSSIALQTTELHNVPSTIALQTTNVNTVPSDIALQTTEKHDIPSTMALLQESTRTVPSDIALLQESKRDVPSTISLLQENTNTVPSSIALFQESTRTVPSTAALQTESTRVVPSDMALLQESVRSVPSTIALENVRSVPSTIALQQTNVRSVPSTISLSTGIIETNAILYVRSGKSTAYVRSGETTLYVRKD